MKCAFYLTEEDRERCERCLDRDHCDIILSEDKLEEPELE